jgi:hypothetical protein
VRVGWVSAHPQDDKKIGEIIIHLTPQRPYPSLRNKNTSHRLSRIARERVRSKGVWNMIKGTLAKLKKGTKILDLLNACVCYWMASSPV